VRFDADVVQWVQKAGKGLSNQNEHGFKKLLHQVPEYHCNQYLSP
jgi:uncharacterized protein (DUF4415 family)